MLTYCTQSDVEAILSAPGVAAFADDNEDGSLSAGELGYIERAIERAANVMNAILEVRYRLSDLASNAWCRDANADIAAYVLCTRRGNGVPAPIQVARDAAMDLLAEIKAGQAKVPEQPESFNSLPAVSNFQVERWHTNQPVRVDVQESTGERPADGVKRRQSNNPNADF